MNTFSGKITDQVPVSFTRYVLTVYSVKSEFSVVKVLTFETREECLNALNCSICEFDFDSYSVLVFNSEEAFNRYMKNRPFII